MADPHEGPHQTCNVNAKAKLNLVYLLIYLVAILDPLIILSYTPLVSVIKTTFKVNIELIAISLTFHMLPFSFLNLFSGTLSDFYYRPKILTYGLCISTIGSLLGALSPNILLFSISRTIQGVGSALIIPITLALLGDIAPREAMGTIMGSYGAFFGVATTLAPLIGGFFAVRAWRLVPLIFSVYSLIGALLIRVTFGARSVSRNETSWKHIFHQYERVVRNRNIILVSIAGFFLFFTTQGVQPFISDFLSLPPLLLSNEEIGVLFAIMGVTGIVFSFVGGILIDKIGSRKTMALGFLLMIVPQSLLLFSESYWPYLIWLSFLGGFQRFALNSVQTLVVGSVPNAKGAASSIFNFARYLGFAAAPVLLARIYVTQGIHYLYVLNLILYLTCFLVSKFINRGNQLNA